MSRSGYAPRINREDSERIYLEILRLEREREELVKAKREELIKATKRVEELHKAKFENEVGKTFMSKVMAKRKARLEGGGGGGGEGEEGPLLPATAPSTTSPFSTSPFSGSGGNRRNLEINLHPSPPETHHLSCPIPLITDRFRAIPPEPIPTPTIVCPNGFKNMKFVNNFTLKFTPSECCGGPREAEIQAKDQDKCLCIGRIDSETEFFLQKQNDNAEMDQLLTFKYDLVTMEWTIAFPELDTVAYLVKPKPASRVSANQIYEIFSADGCNNYFNLGIEMEKLGTARNPEFEFKILNSNLATVATVTLFANFKTASVTIDESLWPSQKAVILAIGLLVSWEIVQDIRRRAAWIRVIVFSSVVLTILAALLLLYIFHIRSDD